MTPYDLIPASWADALRRPWLIPFWALFGNDADGVCGERGGVSGYDGQPVTWWNFLRWWCRNPARNLFFEVLALPLWYSVVLMGTPEQRPPFFPKGDGILVAVNVLPLISFHWRGWEGYAGFHPWRNPKTGRSIAAFGLAFRKNETP